ncbi:hypothetical protein ACH5RR_010130 [Cinchona calisaya]|uniref:Secreted protein n=1 Tax=Cinchona calisaya TaxID=153742 RepID=A0ABD3AIK2_9GENT
MAMILLLAISLLLQGTLGVFLPAMCKSVEAGVGPSRRAMSRIKSSGVASSPVSAIVAGPIPGSDAASDPAISPAGSEASLPDTSAPAPL